MRTGWRKFRLVLTENTLSFKNSRILTKKLKIFQAKLQSPVHLVASRQTGTATSILRVLLNVAGKDIRVKPDGVSIFISTAPLCVRPLYANFEPSPQTGKIPLLLAVEAGNQSMCRELLSVLPTEQLKSSTDTGDTALHLAARRRDLDMVKILVDYGANVDSQNVSTRVLMCVLDY